jgi:hypothetical protein
MDLLRAVVVRLGTNEETFGLNAKLGDVTVYTTQPVQLEGKPLEIVFVASIPVSVAGEPDAPLVIPEEARHKAEATLETVVRLIAIDRQITHSLSSPMPFIGLASDDLDIMSQLDGKTVSHSVTSTRQSAIVSLGLFSEIDPQILNDRLDGVALLSEALNSTTSLGRYMQLIRLFERAFKDSPWKLTKPLAELLAPSPFGIDEAEVTSWTSARDMSAHADRREEFHLDADVRPIVDRMLLASYEVLMNKKTWRDKTSERRDIWRPTAGPQGTGSAIFVTQGKGAALTFQISDGFEAYPMVLGGPFDAVLPRAAWLEGNANGGQLHVKGSWTPNG